MVILESHIKHLMLEDAKLAFPDECCGFLFGTVKSGHRFLSDILVVNNTKERDKRRRFEISPHEYLRAEQFALEKNLSLLSVYHSHPNHPPIPSDLDRVAAHPYFSYIIVSLYGRGRNNILSWRLKDNQLFEPEEILEHVLA